MGTETFLSTLSASKLGLVVFFTVVFTVFYWVAYAIFLGIRENYYRYAQKADLQWTGISKKKAFRPLSIPAVLALAFLTAWIVVQFLIL